MSQQINEPIVDILMPTYKPDLYLLERAIKSIKAQSFKQWKLYLVENGGKTISGEFLKSFDDPRINYHNLEVKGKPSALNYALSISNSKYIAYLDDDDIWFPNHLADAVAALQSKNSKFIFTDAYEVFIEKTESGLREIERRNLSRGVITEKTMWYISHINVVHARELILASGLYDVSRAYFIDWDMLQRMAKVEKPYHLSKYTCEHYIYLDNSANKTNTISSQHLHDPNKSKLMHDDMFRRAFSLLTPDDFVDIAKDIQKKIAEIDTLQKDRKLNSVTSQQAIAELEQNVKDLKSSYSWKITKPLRLLLDFTKLLTSR